MPRRITNKLFEVRCQCDRCGVEDFRQSDGDISLPTGWSFVHVSVYSNQHEGPLLCPACLAHVLAAAAPAQLDPTKHAQWPNAICLCGHAAHAHANTKTECNGIGCSCKGFRLDHKSVLL